MSGSKRDRDRATEAFRRWARAGCPGADQIKDVKGEEDLRACVAVFEELKNGNGRKNMPRDEILNAVRWVYMSEPEKSLRRNEITLRVRQAAYVLLADERTVYRWLAAARKMWAEYRYKTRQ